MSDSSWPDRPMGVAWRVRELSDLVVEIPASVEGVLNTAAVDALRGWAGRTNRVIEMAEPFWTAHGYTGATLVAVVVSNREPARQRPLKVVLKHVPAGDADRESARHHEALASSPEFARTHLVELAFEPIATADGAVILLQHIAGGSLSRYRPVSELDPADRPGHLSAVVPALIVEWTGDTLGLSPVAVTAFDLFRRELAESPLSVTRLDPLRGGGAWLEIDGDVLVNPRAVDQPALVSQRLQVLTGRSHGDLHTGNILVPRSTVADFRLIDLASYRHDAPLSRDPATLLMSEVWPWFERCGPAGRPWLVRYLAGEVDVARPYLPPVLVRLVDAIREAAQPPFQEAGWVDTWDEQFGLSLAASALLHAGLDSVPTQTRRWCVRLSARLLTAFLDGREVQIPPQAADRTSLDDVDPGPTERIPQRRVASAVGRPRRMPLDGVSAIASALLAFPAFLSEPDRVALFSHLPDGVAARIRYSAQAQLHVMDLVRVLADLPDGRDWLVRLAGLASGGGARMAHLEAQLDHWWI